MSNSSLRCSDVASGDEGTCHPHFILMQNEPQTDRGINIAQCSTLPPTLYPHAEWTTRALLPLVYFSTHNTQALSHLTRVQSDTHMVVRMTKKPLGNGDYTAFKKGRHQTHGNNSVKSQLFFTIFFTVRFSSKFAAKYLLKIPPHLICIATVYRWCTVVSVTLNYDKPEVENVAFGLCPCATLSNEGHHISMSHQWLCFICFVVWPTTSLKLHIVFRDGGKTRVSYAI